MNNYLKHGLNYTCKLLIAACVILYYNALKHLDNLTYSPSEQVFCIIQLTLDLTQSNSLVWSLMEL